MVAIPIAHPDGLAVVESAVELRGVSGGLTKAVHVDPVVLKQGEECFIGFRAECLQIRFDPIDVDEPAGDQRLVLILKSQGATVAKGELKQTLMRAVAEQDARIMAAEEEAAAEAERAKWAQEEQEARAREEAEGVQKLDGVDTTTVDEVAKARASKTVAKKKAPAKKATRGTRTPRKR